jgi:hypothetical protein
MPNHRILRMFGQFSTPGIRHWAMRSGMSSRIAKIESRDIIMWTGLDVIGARLMRIQVRRRL